MASVNSVTILGNLGRDPETRSLQSGDKVCNLRVATSEHWKDKASGERKERTEWHSVAIFGPLADVADRYLRKGSKVYLRGKLETRKWQDQQGNDRYSTEIVLRGYGAEMVMLDTAQGTDAGAKYPADEPASKPATGGGYGDLDDDIPFAPEWR